MPPDPWTLVTAKKYDEAARAYSAAYEADGRAFSLRGRARAQLLSGHPEAALADFELLIDSAERSSAADALDAGVCHWFLERPDDAIEQWHAASRTDYTDAAGGVTPLVFLWYAGLRLDDDTFHEGVRSLLGELYADPDVGPRGFADLHVKAWPGPIAPFLLGEIDADELVQVAESPSAEPLRRRQRCQADFAIGLGRLWSGDHEGFRSHVTRVAESVGAELVHEFHLARWEVANDFPRRAFAN